MAKYIVNGHNSWNDKVENSKMFLEMEAIHVHKNYQKIGTSNKIPKFEKDLETTGFDEIIPEQRKRSNSKLIFLG